MPWDHMRESMLSKLGYLNLPCETKYRTMTCMHCCLFRSGFNTRATSQFGLRSRPWWQVGRRTVTQTEAQDLCSTTSLMLQRCCLSQTRAGVESRPQSKPTLADFGLQSYVALVCHLMVSTPIIRLLLIRQRGRGGRLELAQSADLSAESLPTK